MSPIGVSPGLAFGSRGWSGGVFVQQKLNAVARSPVQNQSRPAYACRCTNCLSSVNPAGWIAAC